MRVCKSLRDVKSFAYSHQVAIKEVIFIDNSNIKQDTPSGNSLPPLLKKGNFKDFKDNL